MRCGKGIEKSVFGHVATVIFFGFLEIGHSGFVARFGQLGIFEEPDGERVVESGVEIADVLTHFGNGHAAALELLDEAFDPRCNGRAVDFPSVVFRIVEKAVDEFGHGSIVGHNLGEIDRALIPRIGTVEAVTVRCVAQVFGHPKLVADAHGVVHVVVARIGEILSGLHCGEIILDRLRFVAPARDREERGGREEGETERFEDRHSDEEMKLRSSPRFYSFKRL